ncbi:sugar ABC transporter ATP-binding protein [Jannaschia aquimarina]|uniref:MglA_2 protein n=1 Tax=Jannaschia aquimarina TaxID=935700 RepID=A0A0D1D6N8_9RHOB|nr:sugar ABC transporter ATP-binding protein [Jannaschia aquimarina]KIT15633.1 Galactose/methyl galactoside import ATP-binding protein MglA [Jannaschia aquimarina]SNT03061.1 monosaccharide ABC transporter ATP-binding protein, CUT2 family [Jannaschia aquimarina]
MSLELKAITKRFGPSEVLRGIDLALVPGSVTAFMGANGAGKSTLVRIIAGVHTATAGSMRLDGRTFAPTSPSDALRAGVVVVHQIINENVVLTMDVLENLMIDRLCAGGAPFFRRAAHRDAAQAMLDRIGLDVSLTAELGDLPPADRQMVAIARALAHDPKLLILDEPTSALSDTEAERLFTVIEGLRDQGVPILYISHRMGDIRRLADRIVTLRDGRITGDFVVPLDYDAAVRAMLGMALDDAAHARVPAGDPVLRIEGLPVLRGTAPLNLTLHEGEVTAIVGLVGAGKTELAETLYGQRRATGGRLTLDGAPYAPVHPSDAVGRGVFMAAEDRSGGSIVPDFDLSRNVTLPFLGAFSGLGLVRRGRERARAAEAIEGLGIVAQGPDDPIAALSGGNQQKVVLARWLTAPCRLLMLDEPFQGVDIAARRDIGHALRATAGGRATLILCADLDEALEVADRIIVLSHGAVVGEHSIGDLSRAAIVQQMSSAA